MDGHRKLGGRFHLGDIHALPATQLGANAQIEILRDRVALPAARVGNRRLAPHAGGSVETDEKARAMACLLFNDEKRVVQEGLRAREHRVRAIDVPPARLDEPHACVGEIRDGVAQETRARPKIRVEDRDHVAGGRGGRRGEGAGLVAVAGRAAHDDGANAALAPVRGAFVDDGAGIVRGIVHDLKLEAFARVVELRARIDCIGGDVALVVHRQLHCHGRPVAVRENRAWHTAALPRPSQEIIGGGTARSCRSSRLATPIV